MEDLLVVIVLFYADHEGADHWLQIVEDLVDNREKVFPQIHEDLFDH